MVAHFDKAFNALYLPNSSVSCKLFYLLIILIYKIDWDDIHCDYIVYNKHISSSQEQIGT